MDEGEDRRDGISQGECGERGGEIEKEMSWGEREKGRKRGKGGESEDGEKEKWGEKEDGGEREVGFERV